MRVYCNALTIPSLETRNCNKFVSTERVQKTNLPLDTSDTDLSVLLSHYDERYIKFEKRIARFGVFLLKQNLFPHSKSFISYTARTLYCTLLSRSTDIALPVHIGVAEV